MESTSPPPTASPSFVPAEDDKILSLKDVKTYFFTYDGVVRALDGVTFSVRKGETIGLVGETGCGKSVTAFSITRLIPDPPGRIFSGRIIFKGSNLLWGIEREAKYKPVKNTPRVDVKRRYGRIKEGHTRLSSIRGKDISMIFQEPTAAMNPVFSIWKQLAEALEIHQLTKIVDEMVNVRNVPPSGKLRMVGDLFAAAREPGQPRLREVCREVATALGLKTLEPELFHTLRGQMLDPARATKEVDRILDRVRLKSLHRSYLVMRRKRGSMDEAMKSIFVKEMKDERSYANQRRGLALRILGFRIKNFWYGTPLLNHYLRRPLDEEFFWRTVLLLENVGIANPVQIARGYPHELSGGMLQRVMISMALAPDPALLIADEPTTALDVTIQAQILELMKDLKHRIGTSIILITHDLAVVAETCDRVAVMYAGVIAEVGTVEEVFAKPLHPYTQGLLASLPRLDAPDKKLDSIPGSVPNLIHPPQGCRFHPRCPHVMEKCKIDRPPMIQQGKGHAVACWLYQGDPAEDV
ncbi:MAG: ABC transporter ATP-binding protein [Candidatus Thermoplasmatota archaeon]|jgi:peptide/nickel transport system ATP-binding protein|nr:ABC transporter ATP-binding protein [Candidatus Thermoplasmatota archaeon]MCL5984738.1 ABC transporter ATP-binding protein [Candidatus Thermoplasmatota archaeon]